MQKEWSLRFGAFRMDTASRCLWHGQQALVLTPKAFAVLRYLVESPGQLVITEDLFQAVWPDTCVSDAALTVCTRELRKVLADNSRAPRYIETVHRRGYRFIEKVVSSHYPGVSRAAETSGALRLVHRGVRHTGFARDPNPARPIIVKTHWQPRVSLSRISRRSSRATALHECPLIRPRYWEIPSLNQTTEDSYAAMKSSLLPARLLSASCLLSPRRPGHFFRPDPLIKLLGSHVTEREGRFPEGGAVLMGFLGDLRRFIVANMGVECRDRHQ